MLLTFRDLCLDAADDAVLAAFWGGVLGGSTVADPDGWRVYPPTDAGWSLWVDPVPEPLTVKTPVHLDLRLPTDDVSALLALGAVVVREPLPDQPWWVLADPDGNTFCAFPPGEAAWSRVDVVTPFELVVDCHDPLAQAQWWASLTGGRVGQRPGHTFAFVEGASGFPFPFWVFTPVPEVRTAATPKNRMHWDVTMDAASPDALVAAGARILREPGGDIEWWIMADPEGNEFCAFPADA